MRLSGVASGLIPRIPGLGCVLAVRGERILMGELLIPVLGSAPLPRVLEMSLG